MGTPNFTSISKTAIFKLPNGLPSMPDAEWTVFLGEKHRDEVRIRVYCYRTAELATGKGSDFVIQEMTDQVVEAVGEAAIREFASRLSSDEACPVRLLVARVPPPAMDAIRLQLCFQFEGWIRACPILTLAEFCQAHRCPAPSPGDKFFHGSPNTFYTLASGGFLTLEEPFARAYGPVLLEFPIDDSIRVVDIQQLVLSEKIGRELGGHSAAEMVANMKLHRVLAHIQQILKEQDPNATYFLGLCMRGPPEFVCLQGMQATAVVSASGRHDVNEADIAHEREQRMAAVLANRYS
jgi:hypothetical protein